jgi:hypothetical protein
MVIFFELSSKMVGGLCNRALHGGIGLNTLNDEFLQKWRLPLTLRDDFLIISRNITPFIGPNPKTDA